MEIGDFVNGGWLFYKNEQEKYALVLAHANIGQIKFLDGLFADFPNVVATSETDGQANTDALIAYYGDGYNGDRNYAAAKAADYAVGGTGWYLPSLEEVLKIYATAAQIGVNDGWFIWTSTQSTATEAIMANPTHGSSYASSAGSTQNVRPIKRIVLTASGGSGSALPALPTPLLFNKSANGHLELKELTGSYYANNSFVKIQNDIVLKTDEIISIIGFPVYKLAADTYYNDIPATDFGTELLRHVQLAIAYPAALDFFKSNIVSHEDDGRKLKLNKTNESVPWEWMLDRDDEIHQTKANKSVDRLIAFLDRHNVDEWQNSEYQKSSKQLFISNAADFNRIYPIEESGLFYHKVKPFIAEVQRTKIRPAIGGDTYTALLAYHRKSVKTGEETFNDIALADLLAFVQTAIPMLTMSVAIDRLSLTVMPHGIVQEFKSMIQSRNASQPALDETIRRFKNKFDRSANRALDELKQFLNLQVDFDDYPLLPDNNDCQKYFRT